MKKKTVSRAEIKIVSLCLIEKMKADAEMLMLSERYSPFVNYSYDELFEKEKNMSYDELAMIQDLSKKIDKAQAKIDFCEKKLSQSYLFVNQHFTLN